MFGPGGISMWQLLIILVIVLLLFGTKKIRGMGGDLGAAIKGFRKSVKEGPQEEDEVAAATESLADGSEAAADTTAKAEDKSETKNA